MQWHWVDYGILGIVGISFITGLFRGFVKEVVALGVWILAIWMAFHYSEQLNPLLTPYIEDKTIRGTVAFVGILLAVLVVGGLCNAILSFILKKTGLSGPDRLLGMGFGFVRGVFIVALLISMVKLTSIPYKEYSEQSHLCAYFDPLVNWVSAYMPDVMNKVKAIEPQSEGPVAQDERQHDDIIDITPLS